MHVLAAEVDTMPRAVACSTTLFFLLTVVAPMPLLARPSLQDALRADLQSYLAERGAIEHISAASLSISRPGRPNIDVAAGTTTYDGKTPATPQNLYQIGSNTKAFTAVMLLQLQQDGRVTMNDPVGKSLPQYPAWGAVPIRTLLNMTSGIPTYDAQPAVLADIASHPYKFFSTEHLVGAVYPQTQFKPGAGYLYSNTAYLLSQMIIERLTHSDYRVQFERRFINGGPQLRDVYYYAGLYPSSITRRMVAGYFYSHDADNRSLSPLLNKDVRGFNMSWTQGAGGIVSTPHALTQWARALYESPMLTPASRQEMLSIVSLKTGASIPDTRLDPRGFGLGVAQMNVPKLGMFWYYEGITLGYRMAHAYFPKTRTIIALGLNSQPDSKQDHIGDLLTKIYNTLNNYK